MRIIPTKNGAVRLLPATRELIGSLRAFLPFGLVRLEPPQRGAEFGIVMQCGEEEACAVKQQSVDLDQETGNRFLRGNVLLIAGALSSYLRNGFAGLLMPVAYRRSKADNTIETGFAYFGRPSPTGREAVEFPRQELCDDHFGPGFTTMIHRFIHSLAECSQISGIPLQNRIIGMDIRKRMQLEAIVFGFIIHGPRLICIKAQIDETESIWDMLSITGVTELYHLPSVPMAIGKEELRTAKPEADSAV